ncbi:MAG: 30S ribosomal protein S9 [Actinobacteria bacterium]|nr:MAG: 30S ribosomal protein S9 [Actinomycetota bacterium]
MIDDERPDAPEEGDAPEADAPEADAPNEGAPGDVDPEEVQDAEPSAEPPADADAPNEGGTGDVEPAAEGESGGEAEAAAESELGGEAEGEPEGDAEAAPEAEGEAAPEAEGEAAPAERPHRERRRRGEEKKEDEVVPGAHLEPDLVLAEERAERERDEYADRYGPPGEEGGATVAEAEAPEAEPAEREEPREAPAPRSALDLAADARYQATGKRKTSVARVILRPGGGSYVVNGRSLEDYFPRAALQKAARQPLQTAGFDKRMDVVAKIHGGGISAQAGALRHGVARALVEADPSLRVELKRRGFLSRDARAKERKKAGLKKARKRPQFSKR